VHYVEAEFYQTVVVGTTQFGAVILWRSIAVCGFGYRLGCCVSSPPKPRERRDESSGHLSSRSSPSAERVAYSNSTNFSNRSSKQYVHARFLLHTLLLASYSIGFLLHSLLLASYSIGFLLHSLLLASYSIGFLLHSLLLAS